MKDSCAIEAKRVSVSLSGKNILSSVTLSFLQGKCTAIIGMNGAGKSTLLRSLAGLIPLNEGSVSLFGKDIRQFSRRCLARTIAFLPQQAEIPADTTVLQLVSLGRYPYRYFFSPANKKEDRHAIQKALHLTHLEALQNRQVATLSGGERQRALLAMTLAQEPEVLFLDEPSAYLDIAHQIEVMHIIRNINRQQGMTILMVLHDLNQVLWYTDQVVILKNHGVYGAGATKEMLTPQMLKEVFHVSMAFFPGPAGNKMIFPERP